MVIIKADKKCSHCGAKLETTKRGLKLGRKYTTCPRCGHAILTGKLLYDDLTEKQRKKFNEPYFKKLKVSAVIFVIALILSNALPDKSAGLMKLIMACSICYFIFQGICFLNEKSQTLKNIPKEFHDDLYKLEKTLSKKMKVEGYKLSEKLIEEDIEDKDYDDDEDDDDAYFTCDNCGAKVKEDANNCPKCGAIFDEDEEDDEDIEEPEEIEEEETDSREISVDDKYDSLIKLKDLLDKDIITKEEFEKEKKKIIGK